MKVVTTTAFSKISTVLLFLLHMPCCYMLLATMIQTTFSLPLPNRSNISVWNSIVEEAVEASLPLNRSHDCNLTSVLAQRIVEIIHSRGIEVSPTRCRPRTSEDMRILFMRERDRSKCVTLTRVLVPGLENSGREVFVATTNSSCLPYMKMSNVCFEDKPRCSMSTDIRYINTLSEDYFPRFELGVQCAGCRESDTDCLEANDMCAFGEHIQAYRLLRRDPERCDENGLERWIPDQDNLRYINVGCSCYQVESRHY